MIHNGSWDEASIRAIAPDIDMGYVYMPRMDEKAVLAVESNLTFRVAKDSENLDTVLDFLVLWQCDATVPGSLSHTLKSVLIESSYLYIRIFHKKRRKLRQNNLYSKSFFTGP